MKIKLFRDFKIKSKLIALEAVSIAGLLIVGGISIYTASQINQASTDIREEWLPSVIIAEDLNTAISHYRLKEYSYVISKEEARRQTLEQEMEELRTKVEEGFGAYEAHITNGIDRMMMENAKSIWLEYLECSDRLMQMSRNNIHDKAIEMMVGESNALFEDAGKLFLDVVNFNKEGAEQASTHANVLYRELNRDKITAIAWITVIITVMVICISRAIERPVEEIADGTRRVSNGDLNVYLNYRSKDEIGMLTDSVNLLIKRLRDIIEDEKHLFYEIGNENYSAKSNCESAYRGDFAPILYSIESLKSRLEMAKILKEKYPDQQTINTEKKIERLYGTNEMDATDKKG